MAFPPVTVLTADDRAVSITVKLVFKIVDVEAAICGSSNWVPALQHFTKSRQTDHIGDLGRQEALRSRKSCALARDRRDATGARGRRGRPMGIQINSLELTVEPDQSSAAARVSPGVCSGS